MKKFSVFFLLLLILGCKSLSNFTNQEVTLIEEKSQKFTLENNILLTSMTVNNKLGIFLLDTGATSSVITNNYFLNAFNLTKDNYYTSIKLKGATGNTIEAKEFVSETIKSEIIIGKKKIFKHVLFSASNLTNCTNTKLSIKDGIIGIDVFKKAAQPILLDFENQEIKVLNFNYDTTGFQKLITKIPKLTSKIMIPFKVDGKEIDFLFDTGNNGGFLISDKDCKIGDQKRSIEIETIIGTAVENSMQTLKVFEQVNIKNDDFLDIITNITSLQKLSSNLLGISFIKNFNWILDFNSGAIYVKKIAEINSIEKNNELLKSQLKSGVVNDKLIIGFKNLTIQTKLNVGDQITSINNQKVTPDNICEMQELLNKTQDWDTLNLVTIPAVK